MNRQGMPDADFSTWTSLKTVAECLLSWCDGSKTVGVFLSLISLWSLSLHSSLVSLSSLSSPRLSGLSHLARVSPLIGDFVFFSSNTCATLSLSLSLSL
jgi:hypothetical protein